MITEEAMKGEGGGAMGLGAGMRNQSTVMITMVTAIGMSTTTVVMGDGDLMIGMNTGVHPGTMMMVVTEGVSMSPGIAVPPSGLSLRRGHDYSCSLALRQQTVHQLKDVAPYLALLNLLTQPLESRK